MSVGSQYVMALRKATIDDLDDLTDIACAAFPIDPQWDYRFPRRKEFPKDHWNHTRMTYKNIMETSGNIVNLITVQTEKDGETVHRSIALAVWELPEKPKNNPSTKAGAQDRRDANFKRMKAFTDTIVKANKKWFEDVYGGKKLHLILLGTHPDYQRLGAGTQHCQWGMKLAKEHKVPITLFSSPMGRKLYTHLGFDLLATVAVQVEGEEEKLSVGVMINKHPC